MLVEYEDMFPFAGSLASAAATNHYNVSEVNALLDACQQLGLEVHRFSDFNKRNVSYTI